MSLAERLARTERPGRQEEVRARIQEQLIEALGSKLADHTSSDSDLEDVVHKRLAELIDEEEAPLSAQERMQIIRDIGDNVLGLGPLEPFVRDPSVTEVMVNSMNTIYIERAGKLYLSGARFDNEDQLRRTIDKIVAKVGRRIDESSPYVDARLPDGSRVNAIIPPLALDGPALTIRKFSADPFSIDDLVTFKTVSTPVAQFLEACV
jgi:pilus assembly protein CpaF